MFEKIRKNRVINNLMKQKYGSYEEAKRDVDKYFKGDKEILELLVLKYDGFLKLNIEDRKIYFLKHVNEDKSLIDKVGNKFLLSLIIQDKDLINILPFDRQYEVYSLPEAVELRNFSVNLNHKLLYKYLYELKAKYSDDLSKYHAQIEKVAKEIQFDKLPENIQNTILKIDKEFLKYLNEKRLDKIINNPFMANYLDEELLAQKKEEDMTGIEKGLYCISKGESIADFSLDYLKNISLRFYFKNLNNFFFKDYGITPNMTSYFENILFSNYSKLEKLLIFRPDILDDVRLPIKIEKSDFISRCCKYFLIRTSDLPNARSFNDFFRSDDFNMRNNILKRSKILFNSSVVERCNPELLLLFIKDPDDRNLLLQVVEQSYGSSAREILENRPNITIAEIPTFDIFAPVLIEKLGPGIVHNALSYDTVSSYILGEMGRNPDMIDRFIAYRNIVSSIFPNEAPYIEKLLCSFFEFDTTFNKMNANSLTENQKKNLESYLIDKYELKIDDLGRINVDSLSKLDNYENYRNEQFDEIFEITDNIDILKNILYQRFFGLSTGNIVRGSGAVFDKYNLKIINIITNYNLKEFIDSEMTQVLNFFTPQELDMLQLILIIDKINDTSVIKELYRKLKSESNLLTIEDFKSVVSRIDKCYNLIMSNVLTKKNNLEAMVRFNQPGIRKIPNGNIETYLLDGANFKMLVHDPIANNSRLNPEVMNTMKAWETFENGCSTISCCYMEPALINIYSGANEDSICFGFTDFDYRQIIGISPLDADTSHMPRLLTPDLSTTPIYHYPEELGRTTAETNAIGNNLSKTQNEVALYRRYVDPDKIEKNGNGGRLMPDYVIYLSATMSDEKLEKAREFARKFQKNGKPLPIVIIDRKKYTMMNSYSERANLKKGEGVYIRSETEFIQEINKITQNDGIEKESEGKLK